MIAVDGKTMRGARTGSNPAPHLLAAPGRAAGTALTQRRVADESNEIPALRDLLAPLDLDGAVVTADAMHTQTGTAEWIRSRGAHYVLTVKNNQPGLKRALEKLPWKDVPSTSVPDGSHGRRVRRTVQAVEAPAWIDFPGAAQVIRIRRTRTVNKRGGGRRTTTEVAHLICSLPMTDAPPELVASWARGHWTIENRLHWVRDVVFDEDRHQLRTRNGPQIMAALRNLAISLIRLLHGATASIAATTRAIGQTPFALVYGAEAVLPTELVYGSPRVLAYDELEQEQLRQDDALLLEEDRLQAAVRAARYQQALRRYHSRKVKARSFEEGDLVLRRVQSAKNSNKLTPKWEGPYRVKRVTRPGAVCLETEDGILVSNS